MPDKFPTFSDFRLPVLLLPHPIFIVKRWHDRHILSVSPVSASADMKINSLNLHWIGICPVVRKTIAHFGMNRWRCLYPCLDVNAITVTSLKPMIHFGFCWNLREIEFVDYPYHTISSPRTHNGRERSDHRALIAYLSLFLHLFRQIRNSFCQWFRRFLF